MSLYFIVSFIFFGLLAVVLDFLFIPGGIVAIGGVCAMIVGVVSSYLGYGPLAGTITLICTLVFSTLVLWLILRSKTWRKCALDTNIDAKANEFDSTRVHVGAVGQTLSRLAPSGKAIFDGETVEVVSAFGLIDENNSVTVERIEGNKIIVSLTK
ncbi:MAG: hypothetical protein MJZ49_08095 [Bacteroidales bacterium]|nr:hypothetical protein [Bacteroidales bacterium]